MRCAVWVSNLADLAPLVSRVRRLLDLDADARVIDPALALGDDLPEVAHTAVEPVGGPTQSGLLRLFLTASMIAAHGREVLRGPAARITAIVQTAEALSNGELVLSPGDTRPELAAKLQARPGIGPWTAAYVAMRVLGSPDNLLTSDLALRRGAIGLGLPGTPGALAARGSGWAPWRSYAGMHLWGTSK